MEFIWIFILSYKNRLPIHKHRKQHCNYRQNTGNDLSAHLQSTGWINSEMFTQYLEYGRAIKRRGMLSRKQTGSNFQDIFARGTKAEQRRHGGMTEKLVWGGFHCSTSGKYDYQKEWTITYRIKESESTVIQKKKQERRKEKESWESSSLQKLANKCSYM